jgi:hypothetical protein
VTVFVLAAKTAMAAVLLIAAGAKLADLAGFAGTVRLFTTHRAPRHVVRAMAVGIAITELVLGAASLASPAASWLNLAVLALGCAFVAVSLTGLMFHRGHACRCFGMLSRRRFDAVGVLRSLVIACIAGIAIIGVPQVAVHITELTEVLLATTALLLAFAAFTAARALSAGREFDPGLTSE